MLSVVPVLHRQMAKYVEIRATLQLSRQSATIDSRGRMRESLRREGPAYVLQHELPTNLMKGTIVDLETMGLTPSQGGVICIGTTQSSTLEIRTRARDAKFRPFYDSLMEVVRNLPRPLYACNGSFDAKFLRRHCRLLTFKDDAQGRI